MSRDQLLAIYDQVFEAVDSPEDGKTIQIIFWTSAGNASRPYAEARMDRNDVITDDGEIHQDICDLVKRIISGERINPFIEPRPIILVDVCVV